MFKLRCNRISKRPTSYAYDANGNVSQLTYPDGYTLTRTFDEADHETAITSSAWSNMLTSASYFPFGGHYVWDVAHKKEAWAADFSSFGEPLGTINQNPTGEGTYVVNFRLPGQYAFASAVGGPSTTAGGLTENWNRVDDSITGRYLEPDPGPGKFDWLPTLGGFNATDRGPYTYVSDSPDARTDIRGLWPDGPRKPGQGISPSDISQAVTAALTFAGEWWNLRRANTVGFDKFQHCLANCESTQLGQTGETAAEQSSR